MRLVGNYRVIGSDRCPGAFKRDPTSMLIIRDDLLVRITHLLR